MNEAINEESLRDSYGQGTDILMYLSACLFFGNSFFVVQLLENQNCMQILLFFPSFRGTGYDVARQVGKW